MKLKLEREFNPYLEILGLLSYSINFELSKKETIDELNSLGIAGKVFYDTHFQTWEKVILQFKKEMKSNSYYEFFFPEHSSIDKTLTYIYLSLTTEHIDLIKSADVKKSELQMILIELILHSFDDEVSSPEEVTNDFYEYLSKLEASEFDKWKLFTLYQEPIKYFQGLINLIEVNIPLYEKLYNQKEIINYIDHQINILENEEMNEEILIASLAPDSLIYPTLMHPLAQIVLDTKSYYGLLNYEIFRSDTFSATIDENIIIKLKALSDKSKLQILIALKKRPMYSLEIAEELELTAGTISHHMNVLVGANLVKIEKQSSKVYYQINEDGIHATITKLKSLLFD
ncbi:ArsR/SmtB family transcription factor [Breznakia pachnodae]|uniref:DNA-binding transcriptional ArsR family regulator n=1 Tax=Breznakia pachnodae TaxID=265178 RepID=A0ABU0E529_9FIRM|nr:winged helix-turn-helix domain-containing protein [Breznakia pachnodae]MDQ0361987.1 DNA-binding transcriptional ArsR family regulator [Breznakia pachnodae]